MKIREWKFGRFVLSDEVIHFGIQSLCLVVLLLIEDVSLDVSDAPPVNGECCISTLPRKIMNPEFSLHENGACNLDLLNKFCYGYISWHEYEQMYVIMNGSYGHEDTAKVVDDYADKDV